MAIMQQYRTTTIGNRGKQSLLPWNGSSSKNTIHQSVLTKQQQTIQFVLVIKRLWIIQVVSIAVAELLLCCLNTAVLLRHTKLQRTFVRCSFRFIGSIGKLNRSQITPSLYSSPEATNNKQGSKFCEYSINRLSSASIFARLFFIHCLAASGDLEERKTQKSSGWKKGVVCCVKGWWRWSRVRGLASNFL